LIDEINDLKSNRDYWKERALHHKHSKPVKQVESEWYKCIKSSDYLPNYFVLGGKYKKSETQINIDPKLHMCLISNNGISCTVLKSNFKPVVK